MSVTAPPRTASALSAFRILPNGEGRAYSVVEPESGNWSTIERTIRTAAAVGFLTEDKTERYAVLDVYDDADDIIADYTIPSAHAFRWIYRRLGLRVAPSLDAG